MGVRSVRRREDSSLSAAGPGSAFMYDLQIKLYPSHREVPEVMAEVQFSSVQSLSRVQLFATA